MFIALKAIRCHNRRFAARRPRRPAPRIYRAHVRRRFFLPATAQHVKRPSPVADWLGAAAMLAGMASWGVLLSLLAS